MRVIICEALAQWNKQTAEKSDRNHLKFFKMVKMETNSRAIKCRNVKNENIWNLYEYFFLKRPPIISTMNEESKNANVKAVRIAIKLKAQQHQKKKLYKTQRCKKIEIIIHDQKNSKLAMPVTEFGH